MSCSDIPCDNDGECEWTDGGRIHCSGCETQDEADARVGPEAAASAAATNLGRVERKCINAAVADRRRPRRRRRRSRKKRKAAAEQEKEVAEEEGGGGGGGGGTWARGREVPVQRWVGISIRAHMNGDVFVRGEYNNSDQTTELPIPAQKGNPRARAPCFAGRGTWLGKKG